MRWTLVLAVVGALIITASPGTVLARDPLPPHKDPAAVSSEFAAASVFAFFGNIVDLLLNARHDDVKSQLTKLQTANIPDTLRFILNRYAELLGLLSNRLDAAATELSKASFHLQQDERDLARTHLNAAGASLDEAKVHLKEVRLATDALGRRLGALAAPAAGPLSRAYLRLFALLDRLEALSAQYALVWDQLVTAMETPQGTAPPVPIGPVYSFALSMDAPTRAYPGREVTVSGNITSPDGPDPPEGRLRLLLGDTILEEFTGPPSFQHSVTLPLDALEGKHLLSLEFSPQGPYIGGSATREILVLKLQPELKVRAPGVTFFPRALKISGEVTSDLGPAQDALVTLDFGGNTTTVQTDAGGNFSSSLELPLTGLFLGPQSLRVRAVPQEPWHSRVESEVRVFVINVTNLGLVVLLTAYVGAVLGRAWRRRAEELEEDFEPVPLTVPPRPRRRGKTPGQGPPPGFPSLAFVEQGGPRARIVSSYHSAAQALAARHAVLVRPSLTLRAFLRAVGARIGTAFADLTGLAERALYRSRQPEEAEARQAEDLSRRIEREE